MSLTKTAIPYLTHSWPIVTGCLPDHPCYPRCWARLIHARFHPGEPWVPTFHPERLDAPLRTRGSGHVVGVAFTGDLFAESIPEAAIGVAFGRMLFCEREGRDTMFVLLTKRPQRMARVVQYSRFDGSPLVLSRVFLGFSAWDQDSFDAGWRALAPLAAAGWRVWCSLEPMIGAVDTSGAMPVEEQGYGAFHGGDPRDFSPDPECSTEKEREAHRLACEAWGRGERREYPVSGVEVSDKDEPFTDKRTGETHTIPAGTAALVERSSFGLGVYTMRDPGLSGVILGAESGPGARQLDLAWVRAVRDQCAAAGVAFCFKQASRGHETRAVEWLGREARVPVLDGAVHIDLAWALPASAGDGGRGP